MQLSVIIVNYNVKYFLEQCLCSVFRATQHIDTEVLVVDNHSTDGSLEYLEPRFPNVKFFSNTTNEGYAVANNRALAAASGKYILFLNPDTIIPEDAFEKCISFLEQHPQAGALGVKMVDGTGRFLKESKRAFPAPLTSFYKLSGLARIFPKSRQFARYYLGHLDDNADHEVDVLAGAFMMMPKAVLDITGGFDERFFMYGEDVDLSYRVQQAGYKNYYFAGTTIIHFKGESTRKGSLNYVRLFYKAMSQFVKKHYKGSRAGVFNFSVQLAIWARATLTACAKLLQRMGLPLLDSGIILLSFGVLKFLWSHYVRRDVNYSPNILIIAFPVFTLIFLVTAYYSGLYDRGYKPAQLNRSTLIASLVLLSGYALLPESLRFSRGILVFGILLAYLLMYLLRALMIRGRLLETTDDANGRLQTIIVAQEKDFNVIASLMAARGLQEKILGRVSNDMNGDSKPLGNMQQLPQLIKKYKVHELVFCEEGIGFEKIIATIQNESAGLRNRFHAAGSDSIVGSDSKYLSGDYVSAQQKYKIDQPMSRRNKQLTDVLVAIFFLLSFPLHLVLQKNKAKFFSNAFQVLFRKKTWVGYCVAGNGLPKIKTGIITSTSLPALQNELPAESLQKADEWYASNYSIANDIKLIVKGYAGLCC